MAVSLNAASVLVNPNGTPTAYGLRYLQELQKRTGGVIGIVYAAEIAVHPVGDVTATTIQAAIEELDTDKQPRDATLTAVAGVTTGTDRLIYFTGVDLASSTSLTAFGRSLIDDGSAGAALTTLGVNAAAQTWLGSPSSANLALAVTDETGSGPLVFANIPAISNPVISGNTFEAQGNPFSFSGSVTATLTQLRTKLLHYTGAGAANLTMPTGTDLDVVLSGSGGLPINHGFDFTVRNKGGGTVTILTAAGVTLDEAFTVVAGATGTFRLRKTAANAFTVYRVA